MSLLMLQDWYAVVQLVKVQRYKPEGRGFDSRWYHWKFSSTQSFRPHYGPGVDSTSNRNEYQEYFLGDKGGRCLGLTTLATSCADCLEIWGASTSWNHQGLSRPVMGLLYMLRDFEANCFIIETIFIICDHKHLKIDRRSSHC